MSNKRRLLSNYIMLSSVQAANYILPLLTVPYLVRVLGPEKFGLIAFSQAFIQYFILVTDYGFNYSATREVSINRDDAGMVSEIFSSVMLIKLMLMLVSFTVMCLVVFSVGKFKGDWLIYVFTFGLVCGNVLFPVWFFQGMELMKPFAILNFLSKAIFTVSIFIFIRRPDDYVYVPLINSLGGAFVGLISLWLIFSRTGVRAKIPSRHTVAREMREGWKLFVSTMAISLYTASNTFILGIFTNNTIVGYYSAAEKIVRAAQVGLLAPLSQTIYPHISRLADKSRTEGVLFLKKMVRVVGIPTFSASLALFVFAPWVGSIVLGKQFQESIPVIRIIAFLPFIIGMTTVYANFFLLGFGHAKTFSKIVIAAGLASLAGGVFLVYVLGLGHIGTAINVLGTEIMVLLLSFMAYSRLSSAARLELSAAEA